MFENEFINMRSHIREGHGEKKQGPSSTLALSHRPNSSGKVKQHLYQQIEITLEVILY